MSVIAGLVIFLRVQMNGNLIKKGKKDMYLVRTSIDNLYAANRIAKLLVEEHAAASVHIREVKSIFNWEGKIENNITEYEIEAICDNPGKVKKIIDKEHTYELPEFIFCEVSSTNEFKKWCSDWCK